MKKLIFILLLVVGLLFINVCAEEDKLTLKSIEKVDSSEYVEEINPAKIEDNELYLDLKLYSIGDFIKYKIVVENKSDKNLEIEKNDIIMDDDNLEYKLSFDNDSNVIKKGTAKDVYLIVTYKVEVEKTSFKNALFDGDSSALFKLNEKISNPLTGSNIKYIVIILIGVGGLLLVKYKKTNKLFLLLLLLTPFITYALDSFPFKVNVSYVIGQVKRNPCTYNGELVQGAEYTNGQYTYRYKQERINSNWANITEDGWGVNLTDKESTSPVTTKMCTSINDKPIVSMNFTYVSSKASSIDLTSVDTSNVIYMSSMFNGLANVTDLDVSSFDTRNVDYMVDMFANNSNIQEIDLSGFDISNTISVSAMFSECSRLKRINMDNWNIVNSGNNSAGVFNNTTSLEYIL